MRFELVVIGTSLGGLQALSTLLGGLPRSFPLPIAIAQHRHKDSDGSLIKLLQERSLLPIIDVEDKEPMATGQVYLAPADYHMLVEHDGLSLSTEAPVLYARPSIDVLFETAAEAYGRKVIGIILTGASHDGSYGLAKIKARGGVGIAQEPATSECAVMPLAAINATAMDYVLPLDQIAPCLVELSKIK